MMVVQIVDGDEAICEMQTISHKDTVEKSQKSEIPTSNLGRSSLTLSCTKLNPSPLKTLKETNLDLSYKLRNCGKRI